MSRRSFTVALAGTMLLASCGAGSAGDALPTTSAVTPMTTTSTTAAAAPPDGAILITAFGIVQPRDDGTLEICPSPSADCAGITIVGDITPPETDPPVMQLTGWYDGATLTVTTTEVPDLSGVISPDFTTPCEDLRGSGSVGNPPTDSEEAVWSYLATISNRYAGRWWDAANGVMTIWLVGDDVRRPPPGCT